MGSTSSEAPKSRYHLILHFRVAVHPLRIDDEMPSKLWINQDVLQHAHANGLLHKVDRDLLVVFGLSFPLPYAVPRTVRTTNDVFWLRDPM